MPALEIGSTPICEPAPLKPEGDPFKPGSGLSGIQNSRSDFGEIWKSEGSGNGRLWQTILELSLPIGDVCYQEALPQEALHFDVAFSFRVTNKAPEAGLVRS